MIFLVKSLVLFSLISIIYSSLVALNHMSWKTNHIIRASHIFMASGSANEVLLIMHNHIPNITEVLLFTGCALLLIFDNRRAYQCPIMERRDEYFN